jgi:uncharacterized protein YbjT (DUF2867 family)
VAERLRARGHEVRVGSRSGEPPFDWTDPGTWDAALAGARAVYVSFYPDLAVPGAADAVRAFASRAVAAGVTRLVLLSGRGEPEAQQSEQVIQESGAQWTVVRSSWFFQNFSESFMLDTLRFGELPLPVGDVREPFVDAEDIADVAAAALTEDGHAGRVYEVTGPRLMTFAEAVEEIARAAGRELRFVSVPMDAYAEVVAASGESDDVVALIRYLFTEVLDGRNASLTDGVQQALGRPPRDFRAYAERTAATGVWNEPAAVGG